MPYEIYKLIHVVGLILLFLAVGGMSIGPKTETGKPPKLAMMLHGIGVLAMLVAGFGMMARLEIVWPWPYWLILKLFVWLALALLPMLARRMKLPRGVVWMVAVGLAVLSAWLAIQKPF